MTATVDAGAVREVAANLRAQATQWDRFAEGQPLDIRMVARVHRELADRLDAALDGAGDRPRSIEEIRDLWLRSRGAGASDWEKALGAVYDLGRADAYAERVARRFREEQG